jgi:hypothetical protein
VPAHGDTDLVPAPGKILRRGRCRATSELTEDHTPLCDTLSGSVVLGGDWREGPSRGGGGVLGFAARLQLGRGILGSWIWEGFLAGGLRRKVQRG